MGCGPGKETPEAPSAERRRLSVGQVDEKEDVPVSSGSGGGGDDRGLFSTLTQETLMGMLVDSGQRKFSIGSHTDSNTKQSFANKATQQMGDKDIDIEKAGLGFTCRKGLKPESPNQDSWLVVKIEGFAIYAVFDGHGKTGHDASQFVKENLPKLIVMDSRFKTDDMKQMLIDVFHKVQGLLVTADRMKKVSAQLAGTTATVMIHDLLNNKITTAHVADSTAVLGSYKDGSKTAYTGIALTRDHKPNLKDERARIEKNGGRVVFDGYANHRIYAKKGHYPGLNMSRCLGDILGHNTAGVSCEPEVSERVLTEQDRVLLVCSDGVWEFIQPSEAVDIVCAYSPEDAQKAADALAKHAWDRWIKEENGQVVDDITVILVHIHTMSATA